MKLCELTDDMRDLLKQNLIAEDKDVSYGELAAAHETVDDEALEKRYGDTEFVPEDFASEPRTVTTWVNKQTGLTLTVYGDPREDEEVDLVLSKNGKKLGEWTQDFTETDDDGEECDWSEYDPASKEFFDDVIDCGSGYDAIPESITDDEIGDMEPVK